MIVKYIPKHYGEGIDGAYKLETDYEDIRHIAREVASNYHYKHGGWESDWPVTFFIWLNDDNDLVPYEIELEREAVPSFYIYGDVERTKLSENNG